MSYSSAYKLLDIGRDLPNWKHKLQCQEAAEGVVKAYAPEKVPEIIDLYLKVLSNQDVRDKYDSYLEWSEEEAEVDFGSTVVSNQEFAETLHFEFEHLPSGKVRIHNKQISELPPPSPSPAASSEETEKTESAYTLLDVPPDLGHEAMLAVLRTVADQLADEYGSIDDIPMPFKAGITTLKDPSRRKLYDLLLKWSANEDGVHLGPDQEIIRKQASDYHFSFMNVDQGKVLVLNLGIPKVPPPPPAKKPASPRHRPKRHPGAAHGLVNGQVPPVSLGKRVFQIVFSTATLTHAVDQGDAVVTTWHQTNPDGSPNAFSYRDYLLKYIGFRDVEKGKDYGFTLFNDVMTKKTYVGSNMMINLSPGQKVASNLLSCGLWDEFPWWVKYQASAWSTLSTDGAQLQYNEDYPWRKSDNNYFFGYNGWTSATSKALKTYIYQSEYWARAYGSRWQVSPSSCDRLAKEAVSWYLQNATIFSKKQLRKMQLLD